MNSSLRYTSFYGLIFLSFFSCFQFNTISNNEKQGLPVVENLRFSKKLVNVRKRLAKKYDSDVPNDDQRMDFWYAFKEQGSTEYFKLSIPASKAKENELIYCGKRNFTYEILINQAGNLMVEGDFLELIELDSVFTQFFAAIGNDTLQTPRRIDVPAGYDHVNVLINHQNASFKVVESVVQKLHKAYKADIIERVKLSPNGESIFHLYKKFPLSVFIKNAQWHTQWTGSSPPPIIKEIEVIEIIEE